MQTLNALKKPEIYSIGCAGKITSFNETDDKRIELVLSGVSRFKVIEELNSEKLYRKCLMDSLSLEIHKNCVNV